MNRRNACYMKTLFTLFALCLPAAAFAQEATVTVLGISAEQNLFYEELEQAFNEEYPQWTLNFETMSIDSFQQTLPLSFESGDAPDIFFIDGFDQLNLNDLIESNWVAPVAGDQNIPQSWFEETVKICWGRVGHASLSPLFKH
jgi:ABC-type glycerol-3-phosphate transport system substrate-binding protein